MAETKTFDCVTADLLCNEQSKGLCFDDDGDGFGDFTIEPFDDQSSSCHQINGGKGNGVSESESLIPFPCLSDESIGWMVEREGHHLPRQDYVMRLRNGDLDLSLRCEALDWIIKASTYHKFGDLCLYSAVNLLDRFLSVYNLPEGRTWAIHLAAVSCLSISAKMNEVNVPLLVELQEGNPGFLFEAKTIQRMEILVLSFLNWNVNTYTPFSFMDYFLRKTVTNWPHVPQGGLIPRAIRVILRTMEGIDFLEFRPSEIAAAVAAFVSDDMQTVDIDKALFDCIGVEKGRVAKCLAMVRDLVSGTVAASAYASATTITTKSNGSNGPVDTFTFASCAGIADMSTTMSMSTAANVRNGAVSSSNPYSSNGVLDAFPSSAATTTSVGSGIVLPMDSTSATTSVVSAITSSAVPPSPNGVLDAAFFSYKNGERRVGSCPSSSHTSPDTKKRKLDHMTALKGGS